MAKLTRKNLMVGAEQLKQLAQHLGRNESETVRFAIDSVLHAEEVLAVAEEIRKHGGIEDVFGRVHRPAKTRSAAKPAS